MSAPTDLTPRPTGRVAGVASGALIVLALAGLVRLATGKLAEFPVVAGAMAVVLPVLAVYGLLLGLAIRGLDRWRTLHRAPVLAAFVWGGLVAGPLAALANSNVADLLDGLVGPAAAATLLPPVVAPLVEETLKVLGVVVAVVVAGRPPAGPIEAMMLGAVAGLGFQLAENVGYLQDGALWNPNSDLVGAGQILLQRGLTGLDGHWVYTALAGLAVGMWLTGAGSSAARRRTSGVALLLAAIGLHFLNNGGALLGLPSWFLFLEPLLSFLLLWLAYRLAAREQWRRAVGWLATEPDDVSTDAERTDLRTRRSARAARRTARRAGGRAAARARGRLQQAQIRLATARAQHMPDGPARDAVLERRGEVVARLT